MEGRTGRPETEETARDGGTAPLKQEASLWCVTCVCATLISQEPRSKMFSLSAAGRVAPEQYELDDLPCTTAVLAFEANRDGMQFETRRIGTYRARTRCCARYLPERRGPAAEGTLGCQHLRSAGGQPGA